MRRVVFALLGMLAAFPAAAMEAPPGATTCSGCHGGPGIVALNGRDPAELTTAMEAFRNGSRPATLMNRLVRGFTPAEIEAISQWLSVQK